MTTAEAPAARIAVISLHTSPLDQPGTGYSGGMNVEIRTLAGLLGDRGVAVDVFTRCAGRGVPEVEDLGPLARVIQVEAGPCDDVAGPELPALVPAFADGLARREAELGPYDLVHSHYWLSGSAAAGAARRWGVPLVTSFHTLAEVKNLAMGEGEPLEPLARVAGERRAIRAADLVVVPTREDAHPLIELYGADPGQIRVVPPGVDTGLFYPRDRDEARKRLGVGTGPLILFLGRLQRLKGPDLAVRAFAEALRADLAATADATLLIVGGPSGPACDSVRPWLEGVVAEEGVSDRVRFVPPQAHEGLPWLYSAADVLIMPSWTESFGLAALEAQACGTPVVAADVGGLRHVVRDGAGGFLVDGRDPRAYADRALRVLTSAELAAQLSRRAVSHAAAFPWEKTVEGLLDAYGELLPELETAQAS
ncbi:MAG: glycosyltransferase [Actinomycetota bacterium]